MLGERCEDLGDALLGVEGVVEGFMEDRDRALLTAAPGTTSEQLLSRVTDAVLALRDVGLNEV
ncbi:hypothetical protein [Nocardioides jishulii]|uniref:Uncharacterized protein n=1 Tax=Nocardioides jishulii TaxID=2575440 RepID=A0A4U2YUC2_9ACTN|nr:hypothetical protein [Nocardioides jishulii]QCX26463.1 hypothetical protein FCL41_02065 [Nocardioides jishulii]TKI63731.1 hypothetical protein FC770_00640 [Nocardioides jishulii]